MYCFARDANTCKLALHVAPVTADGGCQLPDYLRNDPAVTDDYWRFNVNYANEGNRVYIHGDRIIGYSEHYDNYGDVTVNETCEAELQRNDGDESVYMFVV